MSDQKRRGLLLLNLGTPDAPEPEAVGKYLKQFLMDKWVIDKPAPLRWLLVNVAIVPKRKYATAINYKKVWTGRGSPLLFHTQDLTTAVREKLPDWMVEFCMRYGNPSIESVLKRFQEQRVTDILVLPLYPQYAESSTRSSIEECSKSAGDLGLNLKFVPAFYDHPAFIAALAAGIRPRIEAEAPEHLLLSFHGLPERHIKHTDRSGGRYCLESPNCCTMMVDANRDCYRAQCYATARALTKELGWPQEKMSVSFQSRLGRTPWIKPFTDEVLKELPRKGIRRLAIACPSFVADCLETIEEIGMAGKASFKDSGGESFTALPCVNTDPKWVDAVVTLAREN